MNGRGDGSGRGPIRLTTRGAMIAVAVAALSLAGVRFSAYVVDLFRDSTFGYGQNTSVLPAGQGVRIVREVQDEDRTIPAGTPGVVVGDDTDEDSAHPTRRVRVEIGGDPDPGRVVEVRRVDLRPVHSTLAVLATLAALSALVAAWYAWVVRGKVRRQTERSDGDTSGGALESGSSEIRGAGHE